VQTFPANPLIRNGCRTEKPANPRRRAINRGAKVVQGRDNDGIDLVPDNGTKDRSQPISRFRPFAMPVMSSTWTVTTVRHI